MHLGARVVVSLRELRQGRQHIDGGDAFRRALQPVHGLCHRAAQLTEQLRLQRENAIFRIQRSF